MLPIIQNTLFYVAAVTQEVKQATENVEKKSETALTLWQQISQFYQGHSLLINVAIVVLVIVMMIPIFRKMSQKAKLSYLNSIAERLANWLSSQCQMSAEKLQPEFLLLLEGKKSELLSDDVTSLTCTFNKISPSQCTRVITVEYIKGDQKLQTTLSMTVEWEDVPSKIRSEFIMKNCKTVVYDFSKQSIIESK